MPQKKYNTLDNHMKGSRDLRPGTVQCQWCGQTFASTRKRDGHQDICEFYGSSSTPRPQDISMPQGYMTFHTFCNENRILSNKYWTAFLAYVKQGQPDLLKLTEEYLNRLFVEYKHGSQTTVGQYGRAVIPMEFESHDIKDENEEEEFTPLPS